MGQTHVAAMENSPLKILLVEDDSADVRRVRSALRQGPRADFRLHSVKSLAAAQDGLARDRFDAVLLDWSLPDRCGLEALSDIRRAHAEVPIVVLADDSSQNTAMEALAIGAQDYLPKHDLSPECLQRVLHYAVERRRMLGQLQAAHESLDRTNQRLSQLYETAHQFVDHVSHEFRTPLTVIKEFVTIMRDGLAGQVSDQQREFLEIVNDRADDLAIIVDDMLDVSKLEAGMLSVWRKQSRIGDVFEHVRPTLQRKAAIKKVSLDVALEKDLPVVFCDPEKIGRVIVNLVVNAIKFCREDGRIRLWARRDDAGSEVLVGVTDDGPGIAPENLQKVFERFHQLETTPRSSTKGFGLGLSIASELVRLNFGQIDVHSEPEKGSTFSFSVPVFNPDNLVARCLQRKAQWPDAPSHVALIVAAIEPPVEMAVSNVVDEFLQHAFRGTDLVLRVEPHRWVAVTACAREETDEKLAQVQASWEEANRSRPGAVLPDLRLRTKGAWEVAGQAEEILRQFRDERPSVADQPARARILVVDDDTEMLRGLEIRLTAAGFEVITALNGETAIRAAGEHHPDAILMDNYMPVLGGLDALARLAEQPRTKDIPVVMISASLRDQQKAMERGARCFLQKPCEVQTIVDALRKVIAQPSPAEAK